MRLIKFSAALLLQLQSRLTASSVKNTVDLVDFYHSTRPILSILPSEYVLHEEFLSACYHGKSENFQKLVAKLLNDEDTFLVEKRIDQCLEMLILQEHSAEMIQILVSSCRPRLLVPKNAWELPKETLDILFAERTNDASDRMHFLMKIRAFYETRIFYYLQRRGLLDALEPDQIEPFFSSYNCNQIPLQITLWALKKISKLSISIHYLRVISDQVYDLKSLKALVKYCPAIINDETCLLRLIRGGSLDVYKYVISSNPTILCSHKEHILIAILYSMNPEAVEVLYQFITDARTDIQTIAHQTKKYYLDVMPTMTAKIFNHLWLSLLPRHQEEVCSKFSIFSRNTELMPYVLERIMERLNLPRPQIIQALQERFSVKSIIQAYLKQTNLLPSFGVSATLEILKKRMGLLDATLPGWQELIFDGDVFDPVLSSFDSLPHLLHLLWAIPPRAKKIDCREGMKHVDLKLLMALPTPIFALFDSIYTNYAKNAPSTNFVFLNHQCIPVLMHMIGCRARPLSLSLPSNYIKNVFLPKMIKYRHFGWIIEILRLLNRKLEGEVAEWCGSSYDLDYQHPMEKLLAFLNYLRYVVTRSQKGTSSNDAEDQDKSDFNTNIACKSVRRFFLNLEMLDKVVGSLEEYLTKDEMFIQLVDIVSEEVLFEYSQFNPEFLQKYPDVLSRNERSVF